jgi:hypothetical protein
LVGASVPSPRQAGAASASAPVSGDNKYTDFDSQQSTDALAVRENPRGSAKQICSLALQPALPVGYDRRGPSSVPAFDAAQSPSPRRYRGTPLPQSGRGETQILFTPRPLRGRGVGRSPGVRVKKTARMSNFNWQDRRPGGHSRQPVRQRPAGQRGAVWTHTPGCCQCPVQEGPKTKRARRC